MIDKTIELLRILGNAKSPEDIKFSFMELISAFTSIGPHITEQERAAIRQLLQGNGPGMHLLRFWLIHYGYVEGNLDDQRKALSEAKQ